MARADGSRSTANGFRVAHFDKQLQSAGGEVVDEQRITNTSSDVPVRESVLSSMAASSVRDACPIIAGCSGIRACLKYCDVHVYLQSA